MVTTLIYFSTFVHLPSRWLHQMSICCEIFLFMPSVFMALCHLACSTSTRGWPNVLTVSHHELLYETGLPAHKLKAILFTAIPRFIDCFQLVTVLATLKARHLRYFVFLDVSWVGLVLYSCLQFFIQYNGIRPWGDYIRTPDRFLQYIVHEQVQHNLKILE